MPPRLRPPLLASLLALAVACAWPGLASASPGERDHDRAREAVRSGQVLPLRTVLQRLEATHPGQVLEVELERKGERWVYEIKLLGTDGRLRKLKLDARTAEPLVVREK